MDKVILLGDAEAGSPFQGGPGFRLQRLLQWAGYSRADFTEVTLGQPLPPTRVVVPIGNNPMIHTIGRDGILYNRGYVWPGNGYHTIPTVSPIYISKGQAKWSAAFINDIQKAVTLHREGLPPQFYDYLLDPLPGLALRWAQAYRDAWRADPSIRLAFDIETPGKGEDEDDNDTDDGAPDKSWHIFRIGFAYRPYEALSIPWEPPYMAAIKLLMESEGEKVVWNAGFDVPRIRRAGVNVNGLVHDGMVAWHILHSDLPKRLGFVATFTCPWQPAWKHLSGSRPAFYNATDADVELRAMQAIESGLRLASLWEVYERDVINLEPILVHMQQAGMPVDNEVRLDRASKLAIEIERLHEEMTAIVPIGARKVDHVYKDGKRPGDGVDPGLVISRPGHRSTTFCPSCGAEKPRKDHFKFFKKKQNPCAGLATVKREVECVEYCRLKEFTPSRDQLTRYQQLLKRPLPMVWDKKERKRKVSFADEQLKKLMIDFPDDKLYPLILDYRAADKLAGTYVGRIVE